jgi:hypothetical protein
MAAEAKETQALLTSPEVQRAIKEAAAIAAAEAVAKVMKAGAGDGTTMSAATEQLLSQLAVGIAELSYQGSGRPRPLAPDIIARREAALKRCEELVAAAQQRGDKPEYRVINKIYFNERLIEPYRRDGGRSGKVVAQEIIWTGMPNEALWPINKVAEEIFGAYREGVGGSPRLQPMKGPANEKGDFGVVAPDNRKFSMTPGGLVVKGEVNPHQVIAVDKPFENELGIHDNNDPNAPEVHILGTVAPPARKNFNDGQNNQVRAR